LAVNGRTSASRANTEVQRDAALLVSKEGFQLYRLAITNPDISGIQITLIPLVAGAVRDIEGNEYRTVKIGNQEWTAENLRTTKYNDSTSIPLVTDSAAWVNMTTPGYCFYNNSNDQDTNKKWGALYNWYAVNTGKVAPEDWHVPTDADWDTLKNHLIANGYNYDGTTTDNLIALSMASKTDWVTFEVVGAPGRNLSMNNSSGFSALPGGHRNDDGSFNGQGYNGHWWCTMESDSSSAVDHEIYYYFWYLGRLPMSKNYGSSIRLVRDH
jgi:uncharacterized protein (TIGR02145 family)